MMRGHDDYKIPISCCDIIYLDVRYTLQFIYINIYTHIGDDMSSP